MRFDTLAYLRDYPKVTGSAHHLLLMLALYGHQDTDVSWPSIATLAHALGVQRCQVQRLLKRLVAVGAVRIVRGGGRRTNTYEVLVPPEWSTPASSRIRGMKSDVSWRRPQTSPTGDRSRILEDTQNRNMKQREKHRAPAASIALSPDKPERQSRWWCEAHGFCHSERLPDHRPDCILERPHDPRGVWQTGRPTITGPGVSPTPIAQLLHQNLGLGGEALPRTPAAGADRGCRN
jgi:hypothetical protein